MQWTSLLVAVVVVASGAVIAGEPTKIGSLVQVQLRDHPTTIDAKVGDMLQLELTYSVVPGQIVTDLTLEFGGPGLTKLTTVAVPKRTADGKPLVGTMGIAAFVRINKAGDVTVKVTPKLGDGKDGQTVEFTVKIAGS
jgi:hypothetical protein